MRTPTCLGRTNPHCTAPRHGTRSAYKHASCRCPHAYEAHRLYNKRHKEGRQPTATIDATGTARRLQALAAIGWNHTQLGQRLNCTPQAIHQWANMAFPVVHHDTADRIKTLYRELAGVPGTSATTRRRALAKGWATPIAWDDNIDDPAAEPIGDDAEPGLPVTYDQERVRRVVAGKAPGNNLLPAEKVEAFRQLQAFGAGYGIIQRRLGLNGTTYRTLAAAAAAGEVAA